MIGLYALGSGRLHRRSPLPSAAKQSHGRPAPHPDNRIYTGNDPLRSLRARPALLPGATPGMRRSSNRRRPFEFNTRQVAEAALAGSSVVRNYDLGVELAGIAPPAQRATAPSPTAQTPAWTTRLWADYVSRYGKTDSYGFSIAYTFGTLTHRHRAVRRHRHPAEQLRH